MYAVVKNTLHLYADDSAILVLSDKQHDNDIEVILSNEMNISNDQSLSFKFMARSVIKKSNTWLKLLYRQSEFLSAHTKELLVNSLIRCHIDYAASAWYNSLSQ